MQLPSLQLPDLGAFVATLDSHPFGAVVLVVLAYLAYRAYASRPQ